MRYGRGLGSGGVMGSPFRETILEGLEGIPLVMKGSGRDIF